MRPTRRRDRASVLVFCVILMGAVGTILLSSSDLGQFVVRRQNLEEADARWDYTQESVKAIMTSKIVDKSLVVPSSSSFNINGGIAEVDAAAGSGATARMVEISTSYTGKGVERTQKINLGKRFFSSPMWFAFGALSTFTANGTVTADSDSYFIDDINLGSETLDITGNVYTTKSAFTTNPTSSTANIFNSPSINPVVDSNAYNAAATLSFSGTQSVSILAFLAVGAYQTLWYNNGDATFNVKYSGKGTCFVKGNVTIKKLDRNSASDQCLLIVDGDIDLQRNNVQAFVYCTGRITVNSGDTTFEGGVWAKDYNLGSNKLTVNFDSFFWDTATWDKRMRVPGQW